jgi:protein TonB
MPSVRQTEEDDHAGYTPTAIPADLLALLESDIAMEPALGAAPAGTRTVPPLIPSHEASLPVPPEPPPGEPDVQPPPVIGGRLEPAVLIDQTKPVYPALAKTARVEGTVVLEGTVNVRGKVENLRVVSGHPMLVDAAIHAVKKWKYRPAKLNGQIIPCPVTVNVRFILQYPGGQ